MPFVAIRKSVPPTQRLPVWREDKAERLEDHPPISCLNCLRICSLPGSASAKALSSQADDKKTFNSRRLDGTGPEPLLIYGCAVLPSGQMPGKLGGLRLIKIFLQSSRFPCRLLNVHYYSSLWKILLGKGLLFRVLLHFESVVAGISALQRINLTRVYYSLENAYTELLISAYDFSSTNECCTLYAFSISVPWNFVLENRTDRR